MSKKDYLFGFENGEEAMRRRMEGMPRLSDADREVLLRAARLIRKIARRRIEGE